MYIIAGKKKLQQERATTLVELENKAKASNLAEDAQAANDYAQMCDNFGKKLHDLELTRMVSVQMSPQIRLVQNNDKLMTDKIQSTLVNTIPLWKSQMVLALGLAHSEQAVKAQREVSNLTNDLCRWRRERYSRALRMSTIETAKESERGIVDMEDPAPDQPVPDPNPGRSGEDPGRGPAEAPGRRAGAGPAGERAEAEAAGHPGLKETIAPGKEALFHEEKKHSGRGRGHGPAHPLGPAPGGELLLFPAAGRGAGGNYYYDDGDYSLYDSIDAREAASSNLITVAEKYTAEDPELTGLMADLEYWVNVSNGCYDPDLQEEVEANREMGNAFQALYDRLSQVSLEERDQKYPGQLLAQMESEQDKIDRASYNDEARAYNEKLAAFPVNLLGKLGGVSPMGVFAQEE